MKRKRGFNMTILIILLCIYYYLISVSFNYGLFKQSLLNDFGEWTWEDFWFYGPLSLLSVISLFSATMAYVNSLDYKNGPPI